MRNIKPQISHVFQSLVNTRNVNTFERALRLIHLNALSHQEIEYGGKKWCDLRKLISYMTKDGQPLLFANKNLNLSVKNLKEVLQYFSYFMLRSADIKTLNIIHIFPPSGLPPVIKNKCNFITIHKQKKFQDEFDNCPVCARELMLNEIKRKVSNNLKNLVSSIRTVLVRRSHRKKKSLLNDRPSDFFLLRDTIAPFPQVEAWPMPISCLTRDRKPHLKSRCNHQRNQSPRNVTIKKDYHYPGKPCYELYCGKAEKKEMNEKQDSAGELLNSPPKDVIIPPPSVDNQKTIHDVTNVPIKSSQELENSSSNANKSPKRDDSEPKKPERKIKILAKKPNMDQKRPPENLRQTEKTNQPKKSKDIQTQLQNVPEGFPHSTIDLSGNATITIIPISVNGEKGKKREVLIRLENIPDTVDVIKIRSKKSQLSLHTQDTNNYSNNFLRNLIRAENSGKNMDVDYKSQKQLYDVGRTMTSPNKLYRTSLPQAPSNPAWNMTPVKKPAEPFHKWDGRKPSARNYFREKQV